MERPRRKCTVKDYSLYNETGLTGAENMSQNIGAEAGQAEDLLQDDLDTFEDMNDESWVQRREAVSDANWQRKQATFQAEMAKLNERELVLERERKLIEMQEQRVARQNQLRKMERDIATRSAALSRYGEVISTERPDANARVEQWVNTHAIEPPDRKAPDRNASPPLARKGENALMHDERPVCLGRDNLYASALQLADDENLLPCRQTGVSRLNTMGLAPKKLQRAGKSEPVLGERNEAMRSRTAYPNLESQPVIGQQDDGESVRSFDTQGSLHVQRSDTSERKKKLKSGMYDKVADEVIMKLKWPHKKLDPRWVVKRPQVHQLQFEHVVAGEIAIIMRSTNPEEVRCRLHILQKLAYWNLQDQGWSRVRDVYTGILHSLEEGDATWTATFDEYDMAFPIKMISGRTQMLKRETFWCREFNKGTCIQESAHKALVAGKERTVMHICAACWRQGKKEKHAETDSACPLKEL